MISVLQAYHRAISPRVSGAVYTVSILGKTAVRLKPDPGESVGFPGCGRSIDESQN